MVLSAVGVPAPVARVAGRKHDARHSLIPHLYDDVSGPSIEGLQDYADLIDLEQPRALSFVEVHSALQPR